MLAVAELVAALLWAEVPETAALPFLVLPWLVLLTPVVVAMAVAVAHGVDVAARQARPGRVRLAAMALDGVSTLAAAVLAVALVSRMGLVASPAQGADAARGVLALTGALAAAQTYALWAVLRHGGPRVRSGVRAIVVASSLGALVFLVALAWGVAQGLPVAHGIPVGAGDAPFVVLAAQLCASVAIRGSRPLPGLGDAVASGPEAIAPLRRNAFLPVAAAFTLLFVVFFLLLVVGVGVPEFVQEVATNPLLLATLLFLAAAFAASVAAIVRLVRTEPVPPPLYRRITPARLRTQRRVLGISLAVAAALALPAVLLLAGQPVLGLPESSWIHFACLATLVATGPYGFHQAREHRRIRRLEERLPDFLRDIASSHAGGLTLTQAAMVARRGEYGPLTPEIARLADQLSWNVPFNEALQRFSDRIDTPLVQRAVGLILEANRSGGATTDVLLAAARDAREIKTLENERRVTLSLYTIVIYVTFFVFLGVVAVLYSQFVPQLVATTEAAAEQAAVLGRGWSGGGLRLADFQLFYFLAALVQGLGNGIVAGLMGQGKAVLGLRHSFTMVLASYLTFVVLIN